MDQNLPQGFSLVSEIKSPFKKILIQGQVGAGKSWLGASIATPEKKALIYDFDEKPDSYAKHSNVANLIIKPYRDVIAGQGMVPEPRAAVNFINDIGFLEYQKKEGKLAEYWHMIDSATYLEFKLLALAMYSNSKARKTVSVGSSMFNIPDGWDAYKDSVNVMIATLTRLFALGDVILIAHERPEEDKTNTSKDKKDRLTGRYSIHPPRLDIIKGLFSDKYRVVPRESGNDNFRVQLETNSDFCGGNTLFGVEQEEVADLAMLFKKSEAARAKVLNTSVVEAKR